MKQELGLQHSIKRPVWTSIALPAKGYVHNQTLLVRYYRDKKNDTEVPSSSMCCFEENISGYALISKCCLTIFSLTRQNSAEESHETRGGLCKPTGTRDKKEEKD